MQQTFSAPDEWQMGAIRVLLLGAGGTGGEVLYALARLHTMLLQLGHVAGLSVTLMDGDTVSAANIGRQRFYHCDLGHSKARVLIHRHNLAFMLDWHAAHRYWGTGPQDEALLAQFDLLISCVDRATVRVQLARSGAKLHQPCLWMDFGNGQYTGQCVLGHLGGKSSPLPVRLPNVFDLHPELVDVRYDTAPSCSSQQAIQQQDLFTNALLANAGISLLWKLIHTGSIDTHVVEIDVRTVRVVGRPIDPDEWAVYRTLPTSTPSRGATTRRANNTRSRRACRKALIG